MPLRLHWPQWPHRPRVHLPWWAPTAAMALVALLGALVLMSV